MRSPVLARCIGEGLSRPIEILTSEPARITAAVDHIPGVGGVIAPPSWADGSEWIVDVWTTEAASP